MPHTANDNPAVRIGFIMHVLAAVILVTTIIWGAVIYPDMPETLPIHWDASGQADAFRQKSIGWAFGPLAIALGVMVLMLVLNRAMGRKELTVPSEREAYSLTFGYVNLLMAVIFSWASFMSWYNLDMGAWLMVLSIMAVLPVLLIMGFYMNRIVAERRALPGPQDPSADPEHWVLGGFLYRNAEDPRTLVPKPPHTGVGMTFNLATPGGKLFVAGLILLVVVPVLLVVLL